MNVPSGNSGFGFARVSGKQNSLFPLGPVILVLIVQLPFQRKLTRLHKSLSRFATFVDRENHFKNYGIFTFVTIGLCHERIVLDAIDVDLS